MVRRGDVHIDIDSHHHNPGTREIGRFVHDYASASNFLGGRYQRKLANNTVVRRGTLVEPGRDEQTIEVVLHRTTIVCYYPNGDVTVNSGRYRTVTTKQRINQLLPPGASIYQKRYDWFWAFARPSGATAQTDFEDGDTIRQEHGQWAVVGKMHDATLGPRSYRGNPGKFDSDLDQWCYQLSLEGVETLGDVQTYGYHYSLLRDINFEELVGAAEDVGDDEHSVRRELRKHGMDRWKYLGAIVTEDDQGFVSVDYYKGPSALDKAWDEKEMEVEGSDDPLLEEED